MPLTIFNIVAVSQCSNRAGDVAGSIAMVQVAIYLYADMVESRIGNIRILGNDISVYTSYYMNDPAVKNE